MYAKRQSELAEIGEAKPRYARSHGVVGVVRCRHPRPGAGTVVGAARRRRNGVVVLCRQRNRQVNSDGRQKALQVPENTPGRRYVYSSA